MIMSTTNSYVYEYIKGKKVSSNEHMFSATELAKKYGLFTFNMNPNGFLVSRLLSDYVIDNNLNVAEYYYPHSHGVMRVYPEMVYRKALSDFCFNLEENKEYVYVSRYPEKVKINYQYKNANKSKIISIKERNQYNGKQ